MRKLDADLGKIYHKNDYYYLEKIFSDLAELIEDEASIKQRAREHGFRVIKSNWMLQNNPHYYIETILNNFDTKGLDPLRYVFKMKLKYMK